MDATHIGTTGREEFLRTLMESYGVTEKQLWQNNNQTVSQEAYVIDVKDMNEVATLISSQALMYSHYPNPGSDNIPF